MEDDESIAQSLCRGPSRYGFDIQRVRTGKDGLAAQPADLVLLDLGLPDGDGLDVCRTMRSASDMPIILISARADEIDRVVGLEVGADDYVCKPFGVRDVVARIRAVLRRVRPSDTRHEPLSGNRFTIDRRARRVYVESAEMKLPAKEYELLAFLAQEPGAVFTREQIMGSVWDANWFGPTKTLDVHIGALRRKLGDAATLETVRGVGFRLVIAT